MIMESLVVSIIVFRQRLFSLLEVYGWWVRMDEKRDFSVLEHVSGKAWD